MTTLEKIRAEIRSNFEDPTKPNYIDAMMRNIGRDECLAVIEKYAGQEPCDDVVSREAVVDDFIEWREKLEYTVGEDYSGVHLLNVAIQKVWDMPPVRPQEQTGHWIRQDNTKEPLYGWYFCSECNSVIGDKTKFCSNCGARMVEPQERSE